MTGGEQHLAVLALMSIPVALLIAQGLYMVTNWIAKRRRRRWHEARWLERMDRENRWRRVK